MATTQSQPGTVWLVGAGPGDPELLTLKAVRLLEGADVILHDSLIPDEILELASKKARCIHTGKRCGAHRMPQARINALMHRYAERGLAVVRLKGGDPFVFGRGGEELEYLRARTIPVEVVPGITAAAGCAAEAQIPLTHRAYGNALILHSGHSSNGGFQPARDYTRVFYMGLNQAGDIRRQLLDDGVDDNTPVAVILAGTTSGQKVFTGILVELETLARQRKDNSPGLIVVGDSAAIARQNQTTEPLSSIHIA